MALEELLLLGLGASAVAAVPMVVFEELLFRHLEKHHPDTWLALGQPSYRWSRFFDYHAAEPGSWHLRTQNFMRVGRHPALEDPVVARLARRARVSGVVAALFYVVAVALLLLIGAREAVRLLGAL